jgi:hypothetical protein
MASCTARTWYRFASSRVAGYGNRSRDLRVDKVPTAALAPAVDESGWLEVSDNLPDFRRHRLTVRVNTDRLRLRFPTGKSLPHPVGSGLGRVSAPLNKAPGNFSGVISPVPGRTIYRARASILPENSKGSSSSGGRRTSANDQGLKGPNDESQAASLCPNGVGVALSGLGHEAVEEVHEPREARVVALGSRRPVERGSRAAAHRPAVPGHRAPSDAVGVEDGVDHWAREGDLPCPAERLRLRGGGETPASIWEAGSRPPSPAAALFGPKPPQSVPQTNYHGLTPSPRSHGSCTPRAPQDRRHLKSGRCHRALRTRRPGRRRPNRDELVCAVAPRAAPAVRESLPQRRKSSRTGWPAHHDRHDRGGTQRGPRRERAVAKVPPLAGRG